MSEPFQKIADEVTVTALKFGIAKQLAADLSHAVVSKLMNSSGGEYLYVPKNDKKSRNELIKRRFNGVNHDTICAEFAISKSTLYRIINTKNNARCKL